MKNKVHFLILGEFYRPLAPWFLNDEPPTGVPAVYELYSYLGKSQEYSFHSIIFNPFISKKKLFPNGSVIELKKFNFSIYYLWKLCVFIKIYFYGSHLIRQNKFSCIYGLSTFATVAAILGRKYSILSVGRIYGTILTKSVKNKNYLKLYTRHIFDILSIKFSADHVIATQDGTQYDKVFNFFNPNKEVIMLYNGMNPVLRDKLLSIPNIKYLPENEPIKFLYIARLESYKRQEFAIEIIRILVHDYQRKNIKLHIVGSGSRRKFIDKKIAQAGLEKHIEVSEELAHTEIDDLLEHAHASMFFYEGGSMGNIMWESALAGKLIITIDNGGTGTIFKDGFNSLILPETPDFHQEMAGKINAVINQDIHVITANARKSVSELIKPWDQRFKEELDIILK